jgi:guanylate kinase
MTIFLITGASGTGKTTLAENISERDVWKECISTTTRPMRKGEVKGETYYFVSQQEFNELQSKNVFVETVLYDGNRYGVTHKEIERVLERNKNAYIIVEHDGYKQLKEIYPDAIGIFLYISKEDCMVNMLHRGDSLDKALKRIETYDDEMLNREDYDYVIKNVRGKSNNTTAIMEEIIKSHN